MAANSDTGMRDIVLGQAFVNTAERSAILVWPFRDAPEHYRKMSTNGGDEDWVAFVPARFGHDPYIAWLEGGTPFGCCCVDRYDLPNGAMVFIGSHA